eukprot:TRINITY_DN102551_c0_g1_i1.p1 TRINITY_DN102551_c0_g1~~TRINITY_DN102551_c0_g1_i1.p1  ORF type:complete len:436 (-),score=127.09 TRINITY_DN102551_c0_g1_i1:81-1388(-)
MGDVDHKLRKRIGWLNDKGGFDNSINYEKVVEAAAVSSGSLGDFMGVLKELEEKRDDVRDPTAFVCSAFRKNIFNEGKGGGAKGRGRGGHERSGGGEGYDSGYDGGEAYDSQDEADSKLRRRIRWLNNKIFDNQINYDKIIEAAYGIEYSAVMDVLKSLEEKGNAINDPTAWCCHGLRKRGGGGGPQEQGFDDGAYAEELAESWEPPRKQQRAAPRGSAGAGAGHAAAASVDEADAKLRRRINWLNGKGGFDNHLEYDKICDAATGVEYSTVMDMLNLVEEKRDELRHPLSWLCANLRNEARHEPRPVMGMPTTQTMTAYGIPAFEPAFEEAGAYMEASAMDEEGERRVRRRIGWLNDNIFEGHLLEDKVMDAAAHGQVDGFEVLRVLKELEEKKDDIKDPTAYVGAALRRRGGSGKGGGKGGAQSGVRKTISKR